VLVFLCGQPALLTEDRLDSESVPKGLHLYHVRHSDDDAGVPCTVEPVVRVNHYGAIITTDKIDFRGRDYMDFDGNVEICGDHYTMDSYLAEFAPNLE